MPPRPRPIRKPSAAATSDASTKAGTLAAKGKAASVAMPPPPNPPVAQGVLEAEVNTLLRLFKDAAVKTGQLYAYHQDTHRLGLNKQLPPPRSLTASVTAEVEKLDQVCDTMEVHLQRAIAIIQRDIAREEQSTQAKQEAVASRTRSKTPSSSPVLNRISLPPLSGPSPSTTAHSLPMSSPNGMAISPTLPASTSGDQSSPPLSTSSSGPSRRASVISLSSLHRPFPHKLDLSALRIAPDELAQGLASPVTLAPRSARPAAAPDFSAELFAMGALPEASGSSISGPAPVPLSVVDSSIDLTLAHDLQSSVTAMPSVASTTIDSSTIDLTAPESPKGARQGLGSSADKPIELDLDMDAMDMDIPRIPDLFVRDTAAITETAASTHATPLPSVLLGVNSPSMQAPKVPSAIDLLQGLDSTASTAPMATDAIGAADGPAMDFSFEQDLGNLGAPGGIGAVANEPSPASLLAGLQQSAAAVSSMPWDLTGMDLSHIPSFEVSTTDDTIPSFPPMATEELGMDDFLNFGDGTS